MPRERNCYYDMKNTTHIMLDIETLGKRPGSVILSIGAVKIRENQIVDRFYRVLCAEEMEALGFTTEIETLKWWAKQSPEAIAEVFENDDERHPQEVARDFALFCSAFPSGEDVVVWSNGAAFDLAHMEEFYRRLDDPIPWHHWNQRCFRTLKSLYPWISTPPKFGIDHHALDDAMHQAEHMLLIFDYIEKNQRPAVLDLLITDVEHHEGFSEVTLGVYEREKSAMNPIMTIHHDEINGAPGVGDSVLVLPPHIVGYHRKEVEEGGEG